MARLYKRGKYWWYQFRGARYSTRCTDRKAAELEARNIERRVADPTYRPSNETTLGAALSAYLEHQRQRGRAPGTLQMQGVHVAHLARVIGSDTPVATIDAREVDRYVSVRHAEGASRPTQGKERTTLRGALRLAARHGYYPHPLDSVFAPFELDYKPLERRLSEPELDRLLAELTPHRAAVCAFIVATGADWGSVATARAEDVDLKAWRVLVRGTKNQYRHRELPVVLPLFRKLLKLAAPHLPFVGWTNAVRDLSYACKRAGVPRVTPRDLRRTHGYILRARGVEPHLIGRSLGHRDSTMVERVYGKLPVDAFEALLRDRVGTARAQRSPREKPSPQKRSR